MLMDYPVLVELQSSAADVTMPVSDAVKYCILGISVTLLLLALGILAWQTYRCCTQTHTTSTRQDNGEWGLDYGTKQYTHVDTGCLTKYKLVPDFYCSDQ